MNQFATPLFRRHPTPMSVTITKGAGGIQEALEKAAKEVQQAADQAARELAEATLLIAQAKAPVDTGTLRESGQVVKLGPGQYTVQFTAPHAMAVHERTEVHHRQGQAKYLEAAMAEVAGSAEETAGEAIAAVVSV